MMVKCREFGFLQGAKSVVTSIWGVVKLRKAITTLVVACAVAAGVAGVATAAGPHATTKKCGTKYTPQCPPPSTPTKHYAKPKIKTPPVSPKCVSTGATYRLPTMTFTAPAGIRTIQVREGSKTVKVIRFRGHSKTRYSLGNLVLHTLGLGSGGHAISVRITDARGRSASKTLRFSVCVSTPVFTG